MNRIHTILRSGPTRKVALAGMALLATVYTVPRVGSDLSSVQTVLTGITPSVADSSGSSTSWDLPNIDNARVDSWVKLFTTDQKVKSRFAVWLDRKSTYEPMISEKLAERDMPQDLIYLAMIESGFNPKAQSPAKAGGIVPLLPHLTYPLDQAFPQDHELGPLQRIQVARHLLDLILEALGVAHLEVKHGIGELRHAVLIGGDTGPQLAGHCITESAVLVLHVPPLEEPVTHRGLHLYCLLVGERQILLHAGGEAFLDLPPQVARPRVVVQLLSGKR